MSRIFLSHSSADEFEAVALRHWLTASGWDDVFLDVDPRRGLAAGERWQAALRRAADRCEAVVFIVSPAWAKSKWCLAEFLLAKNLHKLIFGVVLKEIPIGELPTEMTAEWQLCRLIGPGPTETIRFTHREQPAEIAFSSDGLRRLRSGLESAGLNASYFPWPPADDESRSPYRGLEPLDAQDAAVFFGRDMEILQGLDKLRGMRASADEALFVILGASGAGKSSFLRAGLLPRLARDDRHFVTLNVIRPERSPLFGERGLAHAIAEANRHLQLTPVNLGEVKASLKEGAGCLASLLANIQHAARERLVGLPDDAPPPTVILPVDQAEELFNADATDEARTFLELIGTVVRGRLVGTPGMWAPVIVAFTIRADRYEPLQTAPELAGLKTVVFDALRPMPSAQFKEVITGPAGRATATGSPFEVKPDLVGQLLADCATGADTLPLLGLTLARLYRNYGLDGDLRLDEYHSMGGMADVIRSEAESILANDPELRARQMESLHAAFIPWLATINPENDQPMRRLARMSDLPNPGRPLVHALIEKRLLLSDMRDGEQVTEVAHESLLRQWKLLAGWLSEEREDLKDADRLEQAASAWMRSGRKTAWLIEGERLAAAEALAAKPTYRRRLEPVTEFLLASRQREAQRREDEAHARQAELLAAQEKQAAAEALAGVRLQATEQAQADAARLKKRGRQLIVLVLAAAVVSLLTWRYAIEANQQFRNANALRILADSQAIANGLRPGNDERAFLELLAAWRTAPNDEIEGVLRTTVESLTNVEKMWTSGERFSAVVFSPDGAHIVSGSIDKTLRIWDAATGQPVGAPLTGHEGQIRSVAFSPDGTRILSSSEDKTIRQWDAQTGRPIGEPIQGHDDVVTRVAYSPDGTRIVSASDDKTVRLWDSKTGQSIGAPMKHENVVAGVAFSRDGARLVSGSWDKTLKLWDAATGMSIASPLRAYDKPVTSVAFSPDGTRIVSGSDDGTLHLLDASSGQPVGGPMAGHTAPVDGIAFSDDGTRIVSSSADKTVRLWDAKSGRPVGEPMRGHKQWIPSVAFSPDGRRIVSGSVDGTLRLWDARNGALFGAPITTGEGTSVASVAFSPDGARIVSAGFETLQLWDALSGQPIGAPLRGHESFVSSVAFSPDGTRIVSGGDDGTVRLWDVRTGEPISEPIRGHENQVNTVAFSPDGRLILSGSGYVLDAEDNTLRLWDAQTGKPIGAPMRGHESEVATAAFSPDGTRIVSGSHDATARLWDARTGQPVGEAMRGHTGWVSSVAFSPDGSRIVSGGNDGTVRLWNARTGQPLRAPLLGHEKGVTSVAFSPDGARIVSGGDDGTVRLWDAMSGQRIAASIQAQNSMIKGVAFSPDGTRIVSGGWVGGLRLWPGLPIWANLLCEKLTRNMTHREWQDWVSPEIDYVAQCPGLPIPPDPPEQTGDATNVRP